MRLTLRTLLAYIDDTLDAQTARDIGQKVDESDFAQDLIERIRRVIRTRRLSAPRPLSTTVDANVVAEYLDNVLEKETVAAFEAECLRSDRELAEVAACHQILTMLGQPAHVSEETKLRLTRLVLNELELREEAERLPSVSPPMTFQQPRLLPWVLITGMLLVAAFFVGKVAYDRFYGTARPPEAIAQAQKVDREAVADSGRAAASAKKTETPESAAAAAKTEPTPPSVDEEADEGDAKRQARQPAGSDSPMQPTVGGDEPARPAGEPEAGDVSEARADAAESARAGAATAPAATPSAASRSERAFAMLAGSTHIAVVYDETVGDWVAVSRESPVPPTTPMVNLEGVRTRLVVRPWIADAVDLTGWIWGTSPGGALPAGVRTLDLGFGQVLLRAESVPAKLLVTTPAGVAFLIDARATDTRLAMRFQPVYVPGGPHALEAVFVPVSGSVVLTVLEPNVEPAADAQQGHKPDADGGGAQQQEAEQTLEISVSYEAKETVKLDPGKDVIYRSDRGTIVLRDRLGEGEPEWISGRALPAAQRRSLRQFLKQLPREGRLPPRLLEILHDAEQDENVRALALRSLVALGRLDPVVRMLNSTESVFLRLEAIRWLRWYLALGPAEYAHLAESVYRVFVGRPPADQADGQGKPTGALDQLRVGKAGAVVMLLNGVPDAAARDRELYAALIELLQPDVDLSVRQLAIMTLKELTGEDHGYNPDMPQERALQAWVRDLERGLLPPRRLWRRK